MTVHDPVRHAPKPIRRVPSSLVFWVALAWAIATLVLQHFTKGGH